MPAEQRRWPHKRNVQFSDAQMAQLDAYARERQASLAAVVRLLVDAGLAAVGEQSVCRRCPTHCPTEGER